MAPVVHGLEADYAGQIGFAYLDVDDPANDSFKEALQYEVQPHFFLVDGEGNVIESWRGSVSEDDFRQAFETVLEASTS